MNTTKSLYRIVLTQAWATTWRNKYLWFWGLFAGLLGNAGEYQFIITSFNRVTEASTLGIPFLFSDISPPFSLNTLVLFWNTLTADPFSVFIILVLALIIIAITVFFVWLTTVSVIALIKGTQVIAIKKNRFTLTDGMTASRGIFGSVLVVYIFGRLLLWFLTALIVLFGLLTLVDIFIGLPLFIVGFIALIPALFVVSFVARYAIIYIVVKNKKIMEAVTEATILFRNNWLVTIELAFLLAVINLIVGAVLVGLVWLFVIPILLATVVLWQGQLVIWASLLAILSIFLFLSLLFLFGSVLATFQWASWTHLFLKIQRPGHISKIARILGRVVRNRPITFRLRS